MRTLSACRCMQYIYIYTFVYVLHSEAATYTAPLFILAISTASARCHLWWLLTVGIFRPPHHRSMLSSLGCRCFWHAFFICLCALVASVIIGIFLRFFIYYSIFFSSMNVSLFLSWVNTQNTVFVYTAIGIRLKVAFLLYIFYIPLWTGKLE